MPSPLLTAYRLYAGLADLQSQDSAGTLDHLDEQQGDLETVLIGGAVATAEDLYAKALYIRDCVAIDPGQITADVADGLVAGIERLFPELATAATPPALRQAA